MFNIFTKVYQISFAQNINMWIYYIKKLPLLGKHIPETLYKSTNAKTILANIIRVLIFIFGFIKKYLYMFLMVVLPAFCISKVTDINISDIKFHIFFFLSFIMGPFMNNKFTSDITKDFYMINLMRINAKKYYLSKMIFSYIEYFIYFVFPMMLLGCTFLQALVITLEFVAFRIIVQGFLLLVSSTKKKPIFTNGLYSILLILIPSIMAYGFHFFGITFKIKELLLYIPSIIVILVLAISSLYYLFKSNKYYLLSKIIISREDTNNINMLTSEATFNDVKLDEKKINSKNLKKDKYKDKIGMEYLNLKFLERHKKVLINPVKLRVYIIAILSLLAIIVTIFFSEFNNKISEFILSSSGILVFVLYCISIGEKTTRAFFFNCDNSLLRYKFYKEPKVILSNFKSRLKITLMLNSIPAVTLAIGMLLTLIFSRGDIIRFIPIFISIITLAGFFSIHYLFLYYIIQPYTSQLTIKSPVYKIASFIVYIVSYQCLQVRTKSILFTISIIIITIAYILIAITAIYKYAPKRFKLH